MRPFRGQGISQFAGGINLPVTQAGFAAVITSTYASATGYQWARKALVTPGGITTAATPLTGHCAFALDGSTTIAVGTIVWLEPDGGAQGYVIVAGAAGDGGGGGSCVGSSKWTIDKLALIDRASQIPKGVITYEIYPGDDGGRCDCIEEQYTPDVPLGTEFGGVAHAFYDAGPDAWVGTRLVHSCCSCGSIKFEIPTNDGSLTSAEALPIKGTLTLQTTCDATSPSTYVLRYLPECSEDGFITFAAAGPKLCSDGSTIPHPEPVICDNAFTIRVFCDDCAYEPVVCNQCAEVCSSSTARNGPPIFRIVATGFTAAWADYNGTWDLWFDSNCEWEMTCGTITVRVNLTPTGTNNTTQMTLTFSGGAGGTAVYRYNSPEIIAGVGTNVTCFSAHTLAWVSGSDPNNPDTLAVTPLFCETCDQLCDCIDFENMTADIISTTGECDCAVLTFSSFLAGVSATFGLTGCDNNVQVVVTCAGGRIRVDVSGSAGQSFAEVSLVTNPFEWTVDICFTGEVNDPCTGCIRVVFAAPWLC